MVKKLVVLCAITSLPACLRADFSYDQSTKMTGGALMGVMRMAGAFSKQAREPIVSSTAVKGNKMIHSSKDRTEIIDLDAETITGIDFAKKTYSVMTFAEMKEALERMSQQMQQGKKADGSNSDVKAEYKMSVKATGATKEIAGYTAKEMLMTMTIEGTDQKTGNKANILVSSSLWLTPDVKGYQEVREFYKKMATKLAWTPGANPMMGANPEMAKGMAEVAKEAAKLEGVPVVQVIRTSMEGQPGAGMDAQQAQQAAAAQQQANKQKQEAPSLSGAIAGRIPGFGGFGRKKKQEEPKKEEAAAPASTESAAGATPDGTLMEMTTESSNFSTASVDASKFTVPAGFKKVENEMVRRSR